MLVSNLNRTRLLRSEAAPAQQSSATVLRAAAGHAAATQPACSCYLRKEEFTETSAADPAFVL